MLAQLSGPPSPPSVGSSQQATRTHLTLTESLSQVAATGIRKRKMRGSKVKSHHNCQWCGGRTCGVCHQGCLHHEPTLLICNGAPCSGARIRKGAVFYIAPDGSRQYCQRCYTGLSAVLPHSGSEDTCRYKRDLLKRKNDEEVVESWVKCADCSESYHQVCVLHDQITSNEGSFRCPDCSSKMPTPRDDVSMCLDEELYSFVTGEDLPVPLKGLFGGESYSNYLSADSLPETAMSRFIQQKVRDKMKRPECLNAEKTISIRVISDCSRFFDVPEVVRRHFKMQNGGQEVSPPHKVAYRSKSIALFLSPLLHVYTPSHFSSTFSSNRPLSSIILFIFFPFSSWYPRCPLKSPTAM